MKASEIIKHIEADTFAPLSYAESWDNVGIQIGSRQKEVTRVLISLDATEEVIDQAIAIKADMLITHHPLIFKGIKSITSEDFIGRRIIKMIQSDLVYYAAHTNYDICPSGMAEQAANRLGLTETTWLEELPQGGIGKIGNLKTPKKAYELIQNIKQTFQIKQITLYGDSETEIQKIAISPGSGGREIPHALQKTAQVLITGDISYHVGMDASAQGLIIIDAYHDGIEKIFKEEIKHYLSPLCKDVEILLAKETTPYQHI